MKYNKAEAEVIDLSGMEFFMNMSKNSLDAYVLSHLPATCSEVSISGKTLSCGSFNYGSFQVENPDRDQGEPMYFNFDGGSGKFVCNLYG